MKEIIKIEFEGKIYEIYKENVDYILSKLENPPKKHSKKEIIKTMEKYQLLNVDFLNNINKL